MEAGDHPAPPRRDRYDVVVIGSGLAGLVGGALLAKAGKDVLVVEQSDAPGGYARGYARGPYRFDPAINRLMQAGEEEIPAALWRFLGIDDRLEFLEVEGNYDAVFEGAHLRVPLDFKAFVEEHCRAFPGEADGITRFFETCKTVHRAVSYTHLTLPTIYSV